MSCDPAGFVDGINLYRYSQNNPVKLGDASGTKSNEPKINNIDISEEYWQDNPNLIWNEESQSYHYTDPNTYGTWIGKEGQWIGYTPAEEIVVTAEPHSTRMFNHPAYEGFYQARAEAARREWYDPAGVACGIGAGFAFVGGTILSFLDSMMAIAGAAVNKVDPTGGIEVSLQMTFASTPIPDDLIPYLMKIARSAYLRWFPSSNAKLSRAMERLPTTPRGNVSRNYGAISEAAVREINRLEFVPEHAQTRIPETAGGSEVFRRLDAPIIPEKKIFGMTFPKEYVQVKNAFRLKRRDLGQLVSTLRAAQSESAILGLYLRPSLRLYLEFQWAPRSPVIRALVDELRLNISSGNVRLYSLWSRF